MTMASEAYKTLFGWLNGTRANADTALADEEPAIAQQLLDDMIASLPDAAIVLDSDTRVIAFNSAARVIAPALARGAVASLALRVPEVVEAVRDVAATREPRSVEFSQRVPIDRWFVAHVRSLGAASSGMLLLVFHDLTPVHRAEIMRADFIANASHELRTPLAALSGFIDTLLGPARDDADARARFLAIMKTQATRMARLIDDLLSLSRVELTEHMHPETPVDIVPIVRQVVDGLLAGGKMLDRRDLLDEILHMISCKAAVKAGDYLAPEEITALLEQRLHYQDSHHCPHGRPTALVFTREELDKRFKRT